MHIMLFAFQILHRSVDSIDRRPSSPNGGSLIIRCKDLKVIQIDIRKQEDYINVADSLEKLAAIGIYL